MPTPDSPHQQFIATHSVLIGLTPIIPIPLIDDLVKSYFQRRMVRKLAEDYQQSLSEKDIKTLADDRGSGCLMGCLGMVLLYPFKKIFRKIFFFLEWKRSIDIASLAYHYGYLLEYAFEQGYCGPNGRYSAEQLRDAIDATCREAGTDPIKKAVIATFNQSKDTIKSAAEMLRRNLPIGRPKDEEVKLASQAVEEQQERSGVTQKLLTAVNEIPPSYFQRLRARLTEHLEQMDKNNQQIQRRE